MPPAAPTLAALLGPLAVIATFWLAALYLIKRFRSRINLRPDATRSTIKIIAAKPLAWQSCLLIVEAEGQRFLVAAGRNGLTPIGALDHPAAPHPFPLTVPFPESVL
jgi:flagellar biogenesis protein FliO